MSHNGRNIPPGYPPVPVSSPQANSPARPQGQSIPVQQRGYPSQNMPYAIAMSLPPQSYPLPHQGQVYPAAAFPADPTQQIGYSFIAGGYPGTFLSTPFSSAAQANASSAVAVGVERNIPHALQGIRPERYKEAAPNDDQILYSIDGSQVRYKYRAVNKVMDGVISLNSLGYIFSIPTSSDSNFGEFLLKLLEAVYQKIVENYKDILIAQGRSSSSYPSAQPKAGELVYTEDNAEKSIDCKYWAVIDTTLALVERKYNYNGLGFSYPSSKGHQNELLHCLKTRVNKEATLFLDLGQYKRDIQQEYYGSERDSTKNHKWSAAEKLLAYLKGRECAPFSEEEKEAIREGIFSRLEKLVNRAVELHPELKDILEPISAAGLSKR